MMTKEKLAELQREGQAYVAKAREIAEAQDGDPSAWAEEILKEYNENCAKAGESLTAIRTAKDDLAIIEKAREIGQAIGEPMGAAELGHYLHDDGDGAPRTRNGKSLGRMFTESAEFKAMLAPFSHGDQISIPKGTHVNCAPMAIKGLFTGLSDTSGGAFIVNERTDIVEMLGRKPLRVRDLVSKRRTTSDVVEYVEETSHTNAAAVVAEATSSAPPTAPGGAGALVPAAGGGYKPEGSWAFVVRSTTVKTIAEWVPATKRALADVAQLEGLINDELQLDLAETEENQIMNGDAAGENFRGIANTSGIQVQAFATDIFTSVRKGLTKARTIGRVNPNAILMNPADAETVDLTKDQQNRYYYGGPQSTGALTMWGLPVVESETQTAGSATLGDWAKAVIWDREQSTISMTDSHDDFFVRNLVAILAEERLAFAVIRPSAFVKVALA